MVATVKDIMRMYVHYHKIKNGGLRIMGGSQISAGLRFIFYTEFDYPDGSRLNEVNQRYKK